MGFRFIGCRVIVAIKRCLGLGSLRLIAFM